MADFQTAYKQTSQVEGGYSNNSKDRGKETFAGISRKYWPAWKGWVIIDAIKSKYSTSPAVINKHAFSDTVLMGYVKDFYKVNFWSPLQLDKINDQQTANNAYDFAVNSGTVNASRNLQQAVNRAIDACDNIKHLVVDGAIGNATITAINTLSAKEIYTAFNTERANYYNDLIEADPSQEIFRKSWFSRIKDYKVA